MSFSHDDKSYAGQSGDLTLQINPHEIAELILFREQVAFRPYMVAAREKNFLDGSCAVKEIK